MIIPDINLLLYAHDSSSPFHAKAVDWWQSCLGGTEPIGLPHVVTFGFIRIATNPRVFVSPMTAAEAAKRAAEFKAEQDRHVEVKLALAEKEAAAIRWFNNRRGQ